MIVSKCLNSKLVGIKAIPLQDTDYIELQFKENKYYEEIRTM